MPPGTTSATVVGATHPPAPSKPLAPDCASPTAASQPSFEPDASWCQQPATPGNYPVVADTDGRTDRGMSVHSDAPEGHVLRQVGDLARGIRFGAQMYSAGVGWLRRLGHR